MQVRIQNNSMIGDSTFNNSFNVGKQDRSLHFNATLMNNSLVDMRNNRSAVNRTQLFLSGGGEH